MYTSSEIDRILAVSSVYMKNELHSSDIKSNLFCNFFIK